ncbi:hypothetical protein K5V07_08265 [Flavobacterium sp. CHNK8]|uniref:hypothetical protein n=1 Tax=Flavobacterium sp. CHNK8 TaxID=2871165 RepID=UPI001C8EA9B7|nr:hypothetical protein [Flavobacterium sp. CHNK8]QZK90491.1 hypothetical protein K5V07_08265 [Flavobacterium sp. CHNK8]
MYNSFQIFIPNKNKHTLNINIAFYIPLAFFVTLFFNMHVQPYQNIINLILIVFLIVHIYLRVTRTDRIKPIKGKLEGFIVFEKEYLIVNNTKIDLSEIQSIQLSVEDFIGELYSRVNPRSPNLKPLASNGTNNWIEYSLQNGVKNKIYFRQEYEAQHESIYPFLRTLIQRKIITLSEVLKILDFESEYNLQSFKDSLKE